MKRALLFSTLAAACLATGPLWAGQPMAAKGDDTKAAPSGLPFSEIVRVGNVLYLSGQIGTLPGSDTLVAGGIKPQTRQAMNNIKALLESSGYSMRNLVKCTAMLADISQWAQFNDVYRSFFAGRFPARSAFGVTGLSLGAQVEIECIATTEPGAIHRR